jgi:hypothetical protein
MAPGLDILPVVLFSAYVQRGKHEVRKSNSNRGRGRHRRLANRCEGQRAAADAFRFTLSKDAFRFT